MARAPGSETKDGAGPVRPFVPDGARFIFAPQPSDESLGYFRASLRDMESRHAKNVRGCSLLVSCFVKFGFFHTPPRDLTRATAATHCWPRKRTALRSMSSAAFSAVATSRCVMRPSRYVWRLRWSFECLGRFN